jgi:hypothetical protein
MADGQSVELYEQSHALIIGMSKYQSGWRALPGVETDVVAVRDVLQTHGFTVQVERDLTRDAFDRVMRSFIAAHGRNARNRIVIYFAGHGHTQTASDGRQLGYIVPIDAPLPMKEPVEFKARAVSMDQVDVYAREIESRHALMVFDSCFSGTLFDVSRALPGAIASSLEQPVRQFITAGSAGEEVSDNSEFRRQFVAGLNGEADLVKDGYITASELGMFLESKVASYTRRAQTPKYGKIRDGRLDKGDLIFVSPASPPESRMYRPDGVANPTVATAANVTGPSADVAHWEAIKESRNRADFQEHLKRFPGSPFRSVAERRLEELDREDPVATASRWFDLVQARNVKGAYALLTDQIRQNLPESTFGASWPAVGTVTEGRSLLYEERIGEGKEAIIILVAGNIYQRMFLMREGTRWSVTNYQYQPRDAAVPAKGPPFRDAVFQFLDLVSANRINEAYAKWSLAGRAGLPMGTFSKVASEHAAAGPPQARELVYAEQYAPVVALVVVRTRRASAAVFERFFVTFENGQWMVSSWVISAAPKS